MHQEGSRTIISGDRVELSEQEHVERPVDRIRRSVEQRDDDQCGGDIDKCLMPLAHFGIEQPDQETKHRRRGGRQNQRCRKDGKKPPPAPRERIDGKWRHAQRIHGRFARQTFQAHEAGAKNIGRLQIASGREISLAGTRRRVTQVTEVAV